MEHLHESVRPLLGQSDENRIREIEGFRWIGYGRAIEVLNKLDDLKKHPKSLRMPNLLIVGDTNNGKTILVNRFFSDNKAYIRETDNNYVAPVVYVQVPPKPDERRFYNNILDTLYVPYRFNDRVEKKQYQIIQLLKKTETKVLILDEIHHILAGNMTAQRVFLNVIKYLANELQIVIVGVGIRDAFNAINSDAQLANRFEPAILPTWKMNEEYLRLLASFETLLPLRKQSDLLDDDVAQKILSMSEGTIGEISTIIRKVAIAAIKTKKEYITKGLLGTIDYIPPSERKRQIEKIG